MFSLLQFLTVFVVSTPLDLVSRLVSGMLNRWVRLASPFVLRTFEPPASALAGNPGTRYTAAELNGGQLRIIAQGERSEMLTLERQLHETLPIGPEERQSFYIQKQIENGLIAAPTDVFNDEL